MLPHQKCLANNTANHLAEMRTNPEGATGPTKSSSHRSCTLIPSSSTASSALACKEATRDSVASLCGASKATSSAAESEATSVLRARVLGKARARMRELGVELPALPAERETRHLHAEGERRYSLSGRPLTRTEIGLTKDVKERIEEWLGCCELSPATAGNRGSQLHLEWLNVRAKYAALSPWFPDGHIALEHDSEIWLPELAAKDGISPDDSASQRGEKEVEEVIENADDDGNWSEASEDSDDGEDSESEVSSGLSQ